MFRFLADFANVPLWNYAISETRKVTGDPVGVGSRYRQTRTLPEARRPLSTVTEFEPDRRLSIRGALGPLRGEVAYLLAPAGNDTALTNPMNLQPPGPLRFVAPLAASRVKSAAAANHDTLKQILEGRAADLTTDECRKRSGSRSACERRRSLPTLTRQTSRCRSGGSSSGTGTALHNVTTPVRVTCPRAR